MAALARFGLPHHLTDRLLKHVALYRAVESHKHAELPLGTGVTHFLRKPYIQLCARQRKCAVIKLHRIPEPNRFTYQTPRPLASLSRRALRPDVGPVRSM